MDDPGNLIGKLILLLILILLNAFFAMSEIAVISLNDAKIDKMAEEGHKKAKKVVKLTENSAAFLSTIQIGVTLAGFLASASASQTFVDKFGATLVRWFGDFGQSHAGFLNSLSLVVVTIIMSYFSLVLGELVPKRIAIQNPEKISFAVVGILLFVRRVMSPFIALLSASTNLVVRIFGINPGDEPENVTEEEIRMMVDVGREKGVIDEEEKEIIQNVFEFDDTTAGEIATHRTDIALLWTDETMEQWAETIHDARHSRYPVCDESVDNVVGVLNAKDYFRLDDKSRENVMANAVKPAYFVPEGVKADILFRRMKQRKSQFAVVLDEHGGMNGIITINDLVEQLVGELDDVEDDDKTVQEIVKTDSGTWKILGSAGLEDVARALDVTLPVDEYETFGGFVFGYLGTIPADGSRLEIDACGLHIKVLEIREHRMERALVCINESDENSENADDKNN